MLTQALIDNASFADILFYSALKGMKKSIQDLNPSKFMLTQALIDNESFADILFYSALKGMKKSIQDLSPSNTSLVGFSYTKVCVLESITLKVTKREGGIMKTRPVEFHVAYCPLAYNSIPGPVSLRPSKQSPPYATIC
ncbi:unnamed protein product [Linum trigynum]|uniref:Uncharacterized protein n=1 Tax=Linum trigynum TaxID=586398 RepID=A0AAV2CVX6_9ROSI